MKKQHTNVVTGSPAVAVQTGGRAEPDMLEIDPRTATLEQMLMIPSFKAAVSDHVSNSFEGDENTMSLEELGELMEALGAIVYDS